MALRGVPDSGRKSRDLEEVWLSEKIRTKWVWGVCEDLADARDVIRKYGGGFCEKADKVLSPVALLNLVQSLLPACWSRA